MIVNAEKGPFSEGASKELDPNVLHENDAKDRCAPTKHPGHHTHWNYQALNIILDRDDANDIILRQLDQTSEKPDDWHTWVLQHQVVKKLRGVQERPGEEHEVDEDLQLPAEQEIG